MVQSGANLIQEDTRKGHSRDITDMVEMAMNLLLEDSGLDLHSIFGTGSQSVVLEDYFCHVLCSNLPQSTNTDVCMALYSRGDEDIYPLLQPLQLKKK